MDEPTITTSQTLAVIIYVGGMLWLTLSETSPLPRLKEWCNENSGRAMILFMFVFPTILAIIIL